MKFHKLYSINFLTTLSDVAHYRFHDGRGVPLPSHHKKIAPRKPFSSESRRSSAHVPSASESLSLCLLRFAVRVSRSDPLSFATTSCASVFAGAVPVPFHSRQSFAWQIRVVAYRIEIYGSYFLEPREPSVFNKGRPDDVMGDGLVESRTNNTLAVSTHKSEPQRPSHRFWREQ